MCLVYCGIAPSFNSVLTPNASGAFFCTKNLLLKADFNDMISLRVGRDSASTQIFFRKFGLATSSRSRLPTSRRDIAPLFSSRREQNYLFASSPQIKKSRQGFFAGRTGLEPATSAVTGRCSNQLNYRPR